MSFRGTEKGEGFSNMSVKWTEKGEEGLSYMTKRG